jgi:hypothetical protein
VLRFDGSVPTRYWSSLSPIKVLVAGEGGIIATNDDVLAERCRIGRDYGNPDDYDTRFVGLNARMSELHAATALASFEGPGAADRAAQRAGRALPEGARRAAGDLLPDGGRRRPQYLQGLHPPGRRGRVRHGCRLGRRGARRRGGADAALLFPAGPPPAGLPVARPGNGSLPVTDWAAARVLTLPLWSGMLDERVDRVGVALAGLAGVAQVP